MVTKREKIRVAIGIISGKYNKENLDQDVWDLLGYDTYRFSYYGSPSDKELKEKAGEILLDAICPIEEDLHE